MSVPAPTGVPAAPDRVARPARRPTARPLPSTPPRPRGRARRRSRPAFWILSAAVVAGLVIGIVAVHALLVQTQYAMRSAARESSRLEIEHQDLVKQVAELSSPARVAAWAHDRGMVTPTDVVILRIPGTGDATHAPAAGAHG